MNPLQSRLAALRRRLRLIVTIRGVCGLFALVVLAAVLGGLLDWRLHLPGLVRAVLLIGALTAGGVVAFRFLIRPLAEPCDDLALALRIEARYPFLNDCLASTVQFLEQPEAAALDSPSLRREAVRRTLRQMEGFDFGRVIDSRGVGAAGLSLLGSGTAALVLFLLNPLLAWTALERLTIPFGPCDWPRQTGMEITAERRIARGEPFEIRGRLTGVIPEEARIVFEGISPASQVYHVRRDRESSAGHLQARLEHVERSFRFQVLANDAISDWFRVAVDPPPVLVPLDGRPSPQVRLQYPAYTELPPHDLPDGSGNIETVVGTAVTFRAAADRPLARAWIEYWPEPPLLPHAAFVGLFGAHDPAGVLALAAVGQEAGSPIPAELGPDRKVLSAAFLPRIRGNYALKLEDETGLSNTRVFELRLLVDPAPAVNLERPSRSHDSLEVLAGADVPVHVLAEDTLFAVRSVYLTLRCKNSAGDAEPEQHWRLYDHETVGAAVAPLLSALAAAPVPVPPLPLRLRPERVQVRQSLALPQVRHPDGRELREGDSVTIQACADDFDDVAVDKQPGRSHEIDIHVVSRPTLDAILNREQIQVHEELLRLRKEQQEALQRVIGAEQRWRNTGQLRPQDIDQILQAEQLQQQVRARVGTRQEGLRAQVERVLNTLRSNRLPRTGTHDRMETVAGELERLAREELEQIEPRLTNARKENESAGEFKPPPKESKGQLGEARQHQEEVENTFNELLKLLEPWGNLSAVQGEARAILQEQRQLNEETKNLDKQGMSGLNPESEKLIPEQKAALGRAAEFQRKLEERADQLLGKMQRAGAERKDKDAALAAALQDALDRGQQGALKETLKSAGQNIRNNNLGKADRDQRAGIKTLGEMVQALEERREQELDRLRKKLHEAEEKLSDLTQKQEALRKQIKAAAQFADPQKREQALKRLAREQEQLRREAQEMVRELTRLRADQAAQALSAAGNSMDQAAQQLQRGQGSDEPQEETLDRLNEAQRRTQQAQAKVEEELARERLAQVADQLKQLKERQESAIAETERIQQKVQKNGWDRVTLTNLSDHAEVQKGLGQEADSLGKEKLAPAKVFTHTLAQSAEAMRQAAERMVQFREHVQDHPSETAAGPEILPLQRKAVRRIDQLLDALKTDRGLGQAPAQGSGGGEGGGDQGSGRPSDSIPQLAQLKVLKSLQEEVNERTATFGKRHPELDKLTADQRRELQAIHKDQQEIADLLDELATPQGDKMTR